MNINERIITSNIIAYARLSCGFFTLLLAALPVSSWITGVALHKLTRSDGTTNGGGRRLQSENIVHSVATSNLELYLIINRVDHIEHFFRIVLFSILIKLYAIA